MIAQYEGPASSALLDARRELADRSEPLATWEAGDFTVTVFARGRHTWTLLETRDAQPIALRSVEVDTGSVRVNHVETSDNTVKLEAGTDVGAFRVTVETKLRDGLTILRSTTAFIPNHDLRFTFAPRDLFVLETQGPSPQTSGRLITKQHGFQTGSLFAVGAGSRGSSIFYLQNLSALAKYFEDTNTTPKDSVGGTWPEIGFLLPIDETHPILASNEYIVSDAYLALRAGAPTSEGEIARQYMDGLAHVVRLLESPPTTFRHWPHRAQSTIFDLSHSPECTIEVDGRRYLAPYVNTKNKPPESMCS